MPVLARKPGALRNGAPFKDWVLPAALDRVRRRSALKERERDGREDEIARLKSKVGEITMDNELLSAKIAAMEAKSPLARRRSRR